MPNIFIGMPSIIFYFQNRLQPWQFHSSIRRLLFGRRQNIMPMTIGYLCTMTADTVSRSLILIIYFDAGGVSLRRHMSWLALRLIFEHAQLSYWTLLSFTPLRLYLRHRPATELAAMCSISLRLADGEMRKIDIDEMAA